MCYVSLSFLEVNLTPHLIVNFKNSEHQLKCDLSVVQEQKNSIFEILFTIFIWFKT